jgi:hypothetical protein
MTVRGDVDEDLHMLDLAGRFARDLRRSAPVVDEDAGVLRDRPAHAGAAARRISQAALAAAVLNLRSHTRRPGRSR